MEHNLTISFDIGDSSRVPAQDVIKCQARFWKAARRMKWQRMNPMFTIQFVDFRIAALSEACLTRNLVGSARASAHFGVLVQHKVLHKMQGWSSPDKK